jgi:hypothetical protein
MSFNKFPELTFLGRVLDHIYELWASPASRDDLLHTLGGGLSIEQIKGFHSSICSGKKN